jgi:dephospho-CoA kinase
MILGITGSYCSGKDSAAAYLIEKKGFLHFSLSDIIREKMKEKNIEISRENMIVFGKALREKNGNGILAKTALDKIRDGLNYCITSIRHPDEVYELAKCADFKLVNFDAPPKLRFERMIKRNRAGDPETFEKFLELEKQESQESGSGQQLAKTSQMADIEIINDTNELADLLKKIDALLESLKC